MRNTTRYFVLAAALAALAPKATAEDARGFMLRVLNRSDFKDMQGDIALTLRNKRGDTKQREIQLWSKTNAKEETSMLMRFVRPADVRGTGFLLIEHAGGEDDRRLFLPSLRRVNRISTSGSGGNFMSSDFTYYDIGSPKPEDWSYAFAAATNVAGKPCSGKVVVGTAASAKVASDTGYSKVVWCVDPKQLVVQATDYYEKGDRKLKSMQVLKVEDVGGVPFATHMRMTDAHSGHQSEMEFKNLRTNSGVDDKTFTERNLRRWTR